MPPKIQRHLIRHKIQVLHKEGTSIQAIAKKLKISRNTVRKWVRKEEGDTSDGKRSGRPTKLTPDTKRRITKLANETGTGLRTVRKKLNFSDSFQARRKTLCLGTIGNFVRKTKWGKTAYKVRVKPMMSEKNINDRVAFCGRMVNEGFCDKTDLSSLKMAHVLFTDESPIELNPQPNRQNMRFRTKDKSKVPVIKRPKFPLKIMVAGGISRYGRTELHVVHEGETVNGQYYRDEILPVFERAVKDEGMFPEKNLATLMQDGATPHVAKLTLTQIEKSFRNCWRDWPGNSPDLNPIENVWGVLQDSVFEEPRPRTKEALIARVQEKWNSMPQEFLASCTDSFPTRIMECLEADGGHTKY